MGEAEDDEDQEIEYGREYAHTADDALAEARKLIAPLGDSDVWPDWQSGVPRFLRRTVWTPRFHLGKVRHDRRKVQATVRYPWVKPRLLSELRDNYGLLPSSRYSSEWYGVYRVFVQGISIGRFCGVDPTGTIYIGRAGSKRGWSILRTRLMQLAKREHHVIQAWDHCAARQKQYPWSSLAVDWAYTQHWVDHKGEEVIGAPRAESWLLESYNDCFGEYPPMNEKG
ncbi:hypothetical protein [Bradyrhizobium sp. WD16]|uniref:hypothetical protein n=1 Tax=Bradyrhizobium sp. WD16 TaxID=1521768 RepID=UPI0020A2B9B8|nr:hypothetical protein [Bradyrhizobium sp. WD16]UTD29163.1 hypothetical protein DB459_21895 [Bradyrhizobium sp. WD16]